MNEESRVIQECIKKLAGVSTLRGAKIFMGEVTAVDEDDRECTVTSLMGEDDITYSNVHLTTENNDGFIQFPTVESSVICAKMPNGEIYVIAFSDVDKVICFIDSDNEFEFSSSGFIFNGGTLDGLVKVNPLVTKLNNAETRINLIAADLLAISTAAAATGGTPVTGTTLAGFINAAIANIAVPLTATVKADLENTKIKQ